jgi:hypothetical protein
MSATAVSDQSRLSPPMIDSTSPLPIPVRVLGVDPGLNRTGYAVLEVGVRGPRLREGGVINSTQKFALAERLRELSNGLREVIEEYAPAVMAIEQVFSHVAHPKTAILMAHARAADSGCALHTATDQEAADRQRSRYEGSDAACDSARIADEEAAGAQRCRGRFSRCALSLSQRQVQCRGQ